MNKIKYILYITGVLASYDGHSQPTKPNIIVINCDDMGYGDLSCFGSPTIKTPNIDRMAIEGQKWSSFYVSASVSSPSRAGLLTGRLGVRTGMYGDQRRVLFPDSKGGLPSEELTIAELLKQAGYHTACIGKWHLGHLPEYMPLRHGFDYFYGGGDVLLENCTLYNVRSGAVIVAPSHKDAKYGYAFRNCTIDGNSEAADGRLKLGRPWHNNSKTVYINTIMLIPVADEGWTNMGTVPGIFAEYNSRDAQGNVLDLSKRKTEYQYKDRQTGKEVSGTCQATITKEEADKYTYENMIPGNDGWNPRIMMEKLGSPRSLVYQQGTLKWNPVKNAIGYIVYDGEQILGTTTDTSFPVSEVNYALKVSAVNQYGTQGKKGVL